MIGYGRARGAAARSQGISTLDRSATLVGREQECDLLEARLQAARAGRGQVVLIAGEPGIGKTRLAEEAVRMASSLGMAAAWGRAVEDEGSPPFWPFRTVVRLLAPGAADPWPDLVPSDALAGSGSAEAHAQARFRAFESVTSFLVSSAAEGGLLVVVDDLQWADASSLRLLVHLAGAVADARLVVVATYRDTEIGRRDALKQTLGDLARESAVTRLRLVGLTEPQVAEQLCLATGGPVSPAVSAAVSRRSQGNPFFVGELAGIVGRAGDVDEVVRALPDGVRDAVRGRLARLGECSRQVVATAAVLGTSVDVRGLAQVVGRSATDVLAALDEASAAGVMRAVRPDFTHDLVREAARSDVSRSDRLGMHHRMACHLEDQPDAVARPAEVAHHWLESLPLGDAAHAAEWAERAARAATSQLAWDEAAGLYRRAVEVVDDPARRCELVIALATAQVRAHELDKARESVLEAMRLARVVSDGELLARAVLVFEGFNDLTWSDDERGLCEEALGLLADGDSSLRARLFAQLSVDYLIADPGGRSAELSRDALAMAERLADGPALRAALRARQVARSGPDGVHERLALGDRFVALGLADSDDDAVMWGRLWRFDALMQLGELDRAEAELSGITAVVSRLRLPLATWHLLRSRGAIALTRGRFDEAQSCGDQALALARRGNHPGGLLPSSGFLALLGMVAGFPDEAASAPFDGWEHVTSLHGMIAMVHWYCGRVSEARREYALKQPIDQVPGFLLLPMLSGLIELAEAFDDRPMLDVAYQRMAPHADLFCCGGAGVIATTGSAHGPLGVAAAALGRLDDGVRHLRRAIEVNERAGTPPFAALARFDLARALARRRRPGDAEEAAALVARAAATARELGMTPLLRRTEEFAATLAGNGPGPLTRREREIAVLVSEGLTNRQIAATAHISERTAENHVQHILTKLGFTTRAQIATWVARGEK